jgi:hypothetical protein
VTRLLPTAPPATNSSMTKRDDGRP